MNRKSLLPLIALMLFLTVGAIGLAGCGEASDRTESVFEEEMDFAEGEAAEPMAPAKDTAGADFDAVDDAAQVDVQEQLIIRTAEMVVVVEETETAVDAITTLANDAGGWVVSSRVFQSGNGLSGNITIRVRAEAFDETINEIEALAVEVESFSQQSEDVTEEFVDLSARLENLEATAARVREFLDDAQTVDEALAVNRELSRLESEIEVLKGRIQFLQQSAAFSTISIRLIPDQLSQPLEVGGWQPTGVARDALEALVEALQGLASVAIYVVVLVLPLAVLILLPILLLFYLLRRRRRRRTAATVEE